MKRDIFDQLQLPLGLRIEIDENLQRKPLTQSELARQQRHLLELIRNHTRPGARNDLANPTSAKSFAEVTRSTKLLAQLYGGRESYRQIEKRIEVLGAGEANPKRFGPLVAHMDRTDKVHEAYTELRRIQREESEPIQNKGDARMIVGDFRKQAHAVANGSVDLIFTDPPYDEESLPLFGDLAQFAARVLADGGSLIAYCGHHTVPKVIDLMRPHLTFHCLCASIWDQHRDLLALGVRSGFHPLLWFTKNQRATKTLVMNCVKGEKGNKITQHPWAQGAATASYYVDKLSRRGSVIVDPFLGSGTTAVAALKAGRRFIGFEIDPNTASIAEARIARLKKAA